MRTLNARRWFNQRSGVVFAVVAAVIGMAVVVTHAAGTFMAAEAENGTVAGATLTGSDAGASGGKYVQFGVTADVTISVDRATSAGTSHMGTGVTHTQYSADSWNNATAIANAKQLLQASSKYQNQHIMGWGADNPEPSPGVYDWASLDERVQLMRDSGATKVITLCCSPDWMKGGTAGQTDWTQLEVAPLPSHYADFAALAKQVALRYPDVQYFQVWNEMKGFYNASLNRWDYEGYTTMYNDVYDAVKSVNPNAKIGGPYVVMDLWASTSAGGWPATDPTLYNQPWGTVDQRALDTVSYWLANKHGGDFITIDGGDEPREGTWITDEITAAKYFPAVTNWIRRQPNGGATLPIWWAEWYGEPRTADNNLAHYNAVMANALVQTLLGGAALPLIWGAQGDAQGLGDPEALFTDTSASGGGQATPFYATQKAFHDYFAPGTQLVKATSSSPAISVMASAAKTLLVNTTSATKKVAVNGTLVTLAAYQVQAIDTP